MRISAVLSVICISVTTAAAQPFGEEPGVAQARAAADAGALITEFTHPPAESRAVWLPARDILVPREQLLATLDRLQSAGFQRVMICTLFRGYVLYPDSDILPTAPEADGDLLAFIIEECHKRNLKADAWLEYGMYACFTADPNDPSMGRLLDADPSLASVDAAGTAAIRRSFGTFYSMCPANPKSHEILANLAAEVATRYNIDSVNLDRIRFADWDHLSMIGRSRFENETGLDYESLDVHDPRIVEWKRQQTLAACRTIVRKLNVVRPSMPVTAYVVPPEEMDSKAQSWDLWMKEDLLTRIGVSMYGPTIDSAANLAITKLGGTSKLVAAINAEHPTANLLSNIERSRQLGLQGQWVWFSGTVDDADAAALKAGPWSEPAADFDDLRGRN